MFAFLSLIAILQLKQWFLRCFIADFNNYFQVVWWRGYVEQTCFLQSGSAGYNIIDYNCSVLQCCNKIVSRYYTILQQHYKLKLRATLLQHWSRDNVTISPSCYNVAYSTLLQYLFATLQQHCIKHCSKITNTTLQQHYKLKFHATLPQHWSRDKVRFFIHCYNITCYKCNVGTTFLQHCVPGGFVTIGNEYQRTGVYLCVHFSGCFNTKLSGQGGSGSIAYFFATK